MPKVTVKATIQQNFLSAGENLSGKIWINPTSNIGRQSSAPEVSSVMLTAKCRVRAEWEENTDIKRKSEVFAYMVEKQLLTQPLEINGPKVLDYKIRLPRGAQRTWSLWNPSDVFAYYPGHEIPPSINNVVDHVLEIEVKTEGGFFRSSRQVIQLPFKFIKARRQRDIDSEMQIESKHVTYLLSSRQKTPSSPLPLSPRSPQSPYLPMSPTGFSIGSPKFRDEKAKVTYRVIANLPGRIHAGGALPIELTVNSAQDSQQGLPTELTLRNVTVNIISISAMRVKVAINTHGGVDPEKIHKIKTRHTLRHAPHVNLPIYEGMRIDNLIEGIHGVAPDGIPTFKTYNVARSYVVEVWLDITIGKSFYKLSFAREMQIDSEEYRQIPDPPPPAAVPGAGAGAGAEQGEEAEPEEEYLPAYSGPPPAYNSNGDNRASLTTQALEQGVDIIDLL